MGLDYIRNAAGKPWRKRWSNARRALDTPDLFDICPTEDDRTLTIALRERVKEGDVLIAQLYDSSQRIRFTHDYQTIGEILGAPESINTRLIKCGGIAQARVKRIGAFGNTAEVIMP